MSVKQDLHRLVDELGEADAREALDYLRWLKQETESLTEEELARVRAGEAEIARGEYTVLETPTRNA